MNYNNILAEPLIWRDTAVGRGVRLGQMLGGEVKWWRGEMVERVPYIGVVWTHKRDSFMVMDGYNTVVMQQGRIPFLHECTFACIYLCVCVHACAFACVGVGVGYMSICVGGRGRCVHMTPLTWLPSPCVNRHKHSCSGCHDNSPVVVGRLIIFSLHGSAHITLLPIGATMTG